MGDPDAGCETVSGREERRGDRQAGERGAVGPPRQLPAPPLRPYVRLLGV